MLTSFLMFINPLVGGALIGGAAGLIGGLMTNSSNSGQSKAQRDFQREENEKDRQWQQHMTDYVNEYNTPSNQRQRLEAAGLNPYMMMGSGSTGTAVAASGAQHSATPSAIPMLNPVPSNFAESFLSASLASAQKDNIQAQTEKYGAEAQYSKLRGFADIVSAMSDSKLKSVQTIAQELNNDVLQQVKADRIASYGLNNKLIQTQIDENMATKALLTINTAFRQKELSQLPQKFKYECSVMTSQIFSNYAMGNKSYADAALAAANELEAKARTDGVRISNRVANATVRALVDRATYEAEIKRKEAGGLQLGKFGTYNISGLPNQAKSLWRSAKDWWRSW